MDFLPYLKMDTISPTRRLQIIKQKLFVKHNFKCQICKYAPRIKIDVVTHIKNREYVTCINREFFLVKPHKKYEDNKKVKINIKGNFICIANYHFELHHKVPISRGGGEFDEDNCMLLCRNCHYEAHRILNSGQDTLTRRLNFL